MPPELSIVFEQKYGKTVTEGMKNLEQAIERRPAYSDAMAYLNLMYRQKADMEVSTAAREKDIKTADDLVDQAKAIINAKQSSEAPR